MQGTPDPFWVFPGLSMALPSAIPSDVLHSLFDHAAAIRLVKLSIQLAKSHT